MLFMSCGLAWRPPGRSFPDLPGGIAARPEGLEAHFVAHGVHALPETVVLVGHELPVARQTLERLALEQRGIARDVIEHLRLENEEGAVDPCFPGERLLVEARDPVAVELQPAKTCGGTHGGDGSDAPVAAMELQEIRQVDVGDAVTPCQHEGSAAEMWRKPFDASAGVGLLPGVDEIDHPVLAAVLAVVTVAAPLHPSGLQGYPQVGRERAVVGHVAFDLLALVAERDHEILKSVAGVVHHDVPEDRPASDLDHRFRPYDRLLRESRANAACEDAYFHVMLFAVFTNYPLAFLDRGAPRRSRRDARPRLKLAICVPGT